MYVSCNPVTLARDLDVLATTHSVLRVAAFDQFPYTHHLESGVVLVKKKPAIVSADAAVGVDGMEVVETCVDSRSVADSDVDVVEAEVVFVTDVMEAETETETEELVTGKTGTEVIEVTEESVLGKRSNDAVDVVEGEVEKASKK